MGSSTDLCPRDSPQHGAPLKLAVWGTPGSSICPRWCWNGSGHRSALPGIVNFLLPFSSGTRRLSPAHTLQDALRESFEAKQAALEAHDKMLTFQKV